MTQPKNTDFFTFCYTSGTTGVPKGVMLTNENIVSELNLDAELPIDQDDIHISYLSLADIFERVVLWRTLALGASVGFYQENTLKLMEDIAVLKPTILVSVPIVFDKIYSDF